MLLSPRKKNGLASLFKEVRVFKDSAECPKKCPESPQSVEKVSRTRRGHFSGSLGTLLTLRARGPKGAGDTPWDTPLDTPVFGDTLGNTPGDTSGPKGPRDPCSSPVRSQT